MSVGEEDDRDGEQGVLPGSSLNLRLRPKVEGRERTNRVLSSGSTTSTSGANYENFAVEVCGSFWLNVGTLVDQM